MTEILSRHLTYRKLAEISGVSFSTIGKVAGGQKCRPETMAKIEQGLQRYDAELSAPDPVGQ